MAALTSYRYLRIGMVGAVVLIFVSILIERAEVDCFQTSISAYYYTPVRAIFVGSLMAVGLALIVILGRTPAIDICLNFAGMLAPIVAVVPTVNVGACWSIEPDPRPVDSNGELAPWVVANVDNNMLALLITGVGGLVVAAVIALIAWRRGGPEGPPPIHWGLVVTFIALVAVWWAFVSLDDFETRAHGAAAVLLFAFLVAAVFLNGAHLIRTDGPRGFAIAYLTIGVAMIVAAVVIWASEWDHEVLILEAIEIGLFGIFWIVQTAELWSERDDVTSPRAPAAPRATPADDRS